MFDTRRNNHDDRGDKNATFRTVPGEDRVRAESNACRAMPRMGVHLRHIAISLRFAKLPGI